MTPLDDADELCRLGGAGLVALYASGSVSPVEVTRAVLARIGTVQSRFNAFGFVDHEGAMDAAGASEARWLAGAPLGPLDGVPTTIKDIVWVKGWTIRYGSPSITIRPEVDAPAVAQLRQAGAVLLGLTTTPEFGWKAVTDGPLTGVTLNPWNVSLTPGGSSGGAAVAAACGAGVLHLGTDGGGSIRIPAAFTGTVGMKPSFGRVPAYPASGFGTVAHLGPIARTVGDAALMLQAMSGRDPRDWHQSPYAQPDVGRSGVLSLRGSRVGVWRTPPCGAVEPAVADAFEDVLARLSSEGVELVEVSLPAGDWLGVFEAHWFTGAANRLRGVPEADRAALDPGFLAIAASGAAMPVTALVEAQRLRAELSAAFEAALASVDFVISPGCAVAPFGAGLEVPAGSGLGRWTEWAGFSFPVNLSQSPACVVPFGQVRGGLPFGVQIIAPRGADGVVLAAAERLALSVSPA